MAAALTAAGIENTEDLTYAQLLQQFQALPAEHRSEENNDANQRNASRKDDDSTIEDDYESDYSDDNKSEINCSHNSENEDLDAELDRLRKQCEILRLRKEMMKLQSEVSTDNAAVVACAAPLGTDAVAIEHTIVKFTGDDPAQDVLEFFGNFEEIIALAGGDESFKLLCLRRSLEGAARLLLHTNDAMTYEGLKDALVSEFGDQLTSTDVERMLRARKWRPTEETLQFFVLQCD